MNQLSSMLEELDSATWSEADIKKLIVFFKAIFSRDTSILRSSMMLSLFFTTFESDVTWLDEIAEGLKHVMTAINTTILNVKGIQIDASPNLTLDDNEFVVYLQGALR